MKKDLFNFSDFDDNIVENIAEKCPDMDKSEQKALCGKIRQRMSKVEDFVPADVVSGVEPAKKPVLRYVFGTAAAAVFALATIPVAFKALKNTPDAPENIQESQIIADYNASPTENEGNSSEAVTTKIGESDVTTAISTSVTTASKPTISKNNIFEMLTNLNYRPYTCDGIADYILTTEDGTTYQFLTSCKHVWRNWCEEADITPEILEWIKTYGEPYKNSTNVSPSTVTSTTKSTQVTTSATTTKPVTTAPAIAEDSIFDMLANLKYSPYTCDGIPDFTLQADDGTKYQILIDCKHIWRNSREEADITPEILEWIEKYGEPYKNSTNVSPPTVPTTTKSTQVTTSATTTKPVAAPPAITEKDIFDMMTNLDYRPYTCDGIADYILTNEDGTTYQILTGCKHVWRNWSEEADITLEILEWIKKYGASYKIKED